MVALRLIKLFSLVIKELFIKGGSFLLQLKNAMHRLSKKRDTAL